MSLPTANFEPDDPQRMSPARRRKARRSIIPPGTSGDADTLEKFAHRTSLSFEFFIYLITSSAVIAAGLLVDSPPLLLLGALLAPTLRPLVGLSLGTVTGSVRFFIRSLLSFLIAAGIVFLTGFAVSYATNLIPAVEFQQARMHTQIAWDHLLVMALGALLIPFALKRDEKLAAIPSTALAYELLIPISAAGMGLATGTQFLWPDGLVVFVIQLAWAVLLGAVTLAVLGFRPLTLFGYTLGGVFTLIGIVLLILFGGFGAAVGGQIAIPTLVPTATQTITPSMTLTTTPTVTNTPVPPTATQTQTITPTITPSPSQTPLPSPTPVYALVDAPEDLGGAIIRAAPGFSEEFITSVINGTLLEIISDVPAVANEVNWYQVRLPDGREGWMLESAILVATPVPNW